MGKPKVTGSLIPNNPGIIATLPIDLSAEPFLPKI